MEPAFDYRCLVNTSLTRKLFILLPIVLLFGCNVKTGSHSSPLDAPKTPSASVKVKQNASYAVAGKHDAASTQSVHGCTEQLTASLRVTPFSDSFNQPDWGDRYAWGYNADKHRYPPLDSPPYDGIGDSFRQPPKTHKKPYRSVNTPAVKITTGKAEGILPRDGKMVKFTLRPGDVASDRNRAELQLFKHQDPMCSEAWYGWSVFIPKAFDGARAKKGFFTVGQWHAQRNKKSHDPNLKFRYENPLSIAYVPATHMGKGNGVNDMLVINSKVRQRSTGKIKSRTIASFPFQRGHWVDIIVHIKWSMAADGFVEAWMRTLPYSRVTDDSLPAYQPLYFKNYQTRFYGVTAGNALGNYFKLGLYRKKKVNDRTTGIIYYDEFRRGNSFSEVALRPKKRAD